MISAFKNAYKAPEDSICNPIYGIGENREGITQPFTEHPVHCEYLDCPKNTHLQCEAYTRELS